MSSHLKRFFFEEVIFSSIIIKTPKSSRDGEKKNKRGGAPRVSSNKVKVNWSISRNYKKNWNSTKISATPGMHLT
jgi:hypothetical protein